VSGTEARNEEWGPAARIAAAAGVLISTVSISLFLYAVSPMASSFLCAAFIAGGVVCRRRATSALARALAVALLVGGAVAALASIGLAAAGR
jgi:hypothetical protein